MVGLGWRPHRSELILAFLVAVAAAPAAAQVDAGGAQPGTGDTQPKTEVKCDPVKSVRQLNQYIALQDCWDQSNGNGGGTLVADYYTKWRVKLLSTKPDEFFRDYDGEHRGLVTRLFSGKTRSTIVGLKLQINDPSLEFNIPLMALNYEGKVGNGQSYATTLTSSNADQPYFRLAATTSTAITLSAKSTEDADSRLAARTLTAVQNALKVAAPQATLITELSKDSSSRLASAVDTTLASLLSEARTETISATKALESWKQGASFVVRVELPADTPLRNARRKSPNDKNGHVEEGSLFFEVSLACPRLSIFHSEDMCVHKNETSEKQVEDIQKHVTAPQVLSFELSPGTTLRQHIASRDFFLNFLRDLPEAPISQDDSYRLAAFCDAVVTELRAVGLSTLDAKIGTWAVISGIGDLAAIRDAAEDPAVSRTCNRARPSDAWKYNRQL